MGYLHPKENSGPTLGRPAKCAGFVPAPWAGAATQGRHGHRAGPVVPVLRCAGPRTPDGSVRFGIFILVRICLLLPQRQWESCHKSAQLFDLPIACGSFVPKHLDYFSLFSTAATQLSGISMGCAYPWYRYYSSVFEFVNPYLSSIRSDSNSNPRI